MVTKVQRPLRLLVVTGDLRKESLAGSYRIRQFIRHFREYGCHISVVCAYADANWPDAEGIDIFIIPFDEPKTRLGRLISRALNPPDPFIRWARKTSLWLDRTPKFGPFDVALVSSPPHSIQDVANHLRNNLQIPVVVDLRDDWLTNHRQRWITPFHRLTASRLETSVLESADKVVLNTEIVRARFAARHPAQLAKLDVITNGYDELDYSEPTSAGLETQTEVGVLAYAGASYGSYMDEMLSALARRLINRGMDRRWKIESMGAGSWKGNGVPPVWTHLGVLDQALTSKRLKNANVLILPMPPGERQPSGTVPLKAYGYLRSGRTIVYIGESGSTTELLAGFAGTHAMDRSGWEELPEWLTKNADCARRRHNRFGVEKYAFSELSRRMYSLLRECAEKSDINQTS